MPDLTDEMIHEVVDRRARDLYAESERAKTADAPDRAWDWDVEPLAEQVQWRLWAAEALLREAFESSPWEAVQELWSDSWIPPIRKETRRAKDGVVRYEAILDGKGVRLPQLYALMRRAEAPELADVKIITGLRSTTVTFSWEPPRDRV